MLEIFIFLQKKINLEHKTQHAVNTHANTSNGIKIPTLLAQCPFNTLIKNMKCLRVVEWVALIRFLFGVCHY